VKRLTISSTNGEIVSAVNALIDERNEYEEAAEAALLFGEGCTCEDEAQPVNEALDRAVIIALDSLAHDARNGELSIVDQQAAAVAILDYDLVDSSIRWTAED
jgi:hypothetical protein